MQRKIKEVWKASETGRKKVILPKKHQKLAEIKPLRIPQMLLPIPKLLMRIAYPELIKTENALERLPPTMAMWK